MKSLYADEDEKEDAYDLEIDDYESSYARLLAMEGYDAGDCSDCVFLDDFVFV